VRDVTKTLFLSLLERYRSIIKGERPFLEKLEIILFDKTEIASQYQGELLQSVIQSDPEIQRFIESMWQGEINQLMLDFLEEGKEQGCIDPQLSQEAILVYFEIWRKGMYASSGLPANIAHNAKLVRELMSLFTYGLNG